MNVPERTERRPAPAELRWSGACALALLALLLASTARAHGQAATGGRPVLRQSPSNDYSSEGSAPTAAGVRGGPALVESVLDVLATGDQAAYERFVRKNYAPAALAEYPAEDQAAALARIYADTGGFTLERVVGETSQWVQAEARDRIAGGRYCLTLTRSQESGRDLITDFSARGLYPAGPQLKTPTPDEVIRTVKALADGYAARDLLSGVILIAKDDKIIFEKAYGRASVAYDAPMTLATRLNIASIGKCLTGVAIAQLVDAGKLSYDALVGTVLPDYPDQAVREKVTVRQLLSHTSGLGPKDYYEGPLWAQRSRLRSVADYMRLVAGTPLGGEPGKYHYSNSGYLILGAIIERVTGRGYYDYVREHIFETAGMTRSFYHEMDAEDADVATPLTNLFNRGEDSYIYRLGRPRSAVYELAARGGPQGGAYVTAHDLFRFQMVLREGQLVSSARFAEMTTAQSPAGAGAPGLAGEAREGLGVEVITRNGHTFFGHSGGDLGVAAIVYWYPDSGYTTILLSNRDPRAARVVANATRTLVTRQTINGAVPPDQACVPPKAAD
jgi:CubicO group peptidase (beta-lactamase class C family)